MKKRCLIIVVGSVLFTNIVLLAFLTYKTKENERIDDKSKYYFSKLIADFYINRWEDIKLGDTVKLHPILLPVYDTSIDNIDSIPDVVLYRYLYDKQTFMFVGSESYLDFYSNAISFVANKPGKIDIFGFIELNEGKHKGERFGIRSKIFVNKLNEDYSYEHFYPEKDHLVDDFLKFIKKIDKENCNDE